MRQYKVIKQSTKIIQQNMKMYVAKKNYQIVVQRLIKGMQRYYCGQKVRKYVAKLHHNAELMISVKEEIILSL